MAVPMKAAIISIVIAVAAGVAHAEPAHGITFGFSRARYDSEHGGFPNVSCLDHTGAVLDAWRRVVPGIRGRVVLGHGTGDCGRVDTSFFHAAAGLDRRSCTTHACFGAGLDAGTYRYYDYQIEGARYSFWAPSGTLSLFAELIVNDTGIFGLRAFLRGQAVLDGHDNGSPFVTGHGIELYAGGQF